MRKFLIGLAVVSITTAAFAVSASAQVTGIRHSDGSWTYIDSKGRDIHADYYRRGMAEYNARHGYPDDWSGRQSWNDGYAPRHHRKSRKTAPAQ